MARKPRASEAGPGTRPALVQQILAALLVIVAIVGWWAASSDEAPVIVPEPWSVAEGVARLFYDPTVIGHTLLSTVRVVAAVMIATLLGLCLALIGHGLPLMTVIVNRRVLPFLNSFPSVGWALLGVIWFGPSDFTVIFVEVMILTPFALVNIAAGLRELDAETTEMAKSFTRNRWRVFRKVTLPLLMPYIVAAIRIAYGVGWKIALVAELFGGESGLGFLMRRAQTLADATTVFATCFAIVIIFFLGEKLIIDPLSRRFQHR